MPEAAAELGIVVVPPAAAAAVATPTEPPAMIAAPTTSRIAQQPFAAPPPRRLGDAEILAAIELMHFATAKPPAGDTLSGLDWRLCPARAPIGPALVTAAPGPRVVAGRWSLDAWLLLRGGGTSAIAPQLGGSQAGARLAYALDVHGRAAAYARISSALRAPDPEAALGAQLRPTRLPVVAFAELRRPAGGGLAPAAGVAGGVDRAPLGLGLVADAYGQAGYVGGRVDSGFVDGQFRITAPLATRPVALDVGAGAWGGAQRGAERLDIGPTLGLGLPLGKGSLRLTLDARQRIAGRAAPGSGVALTLGASF